MEFEDLTWDTVRDPGLYIVTLNNTQLLDDGAHHPIPVNHEHCKIGQAVNLFNRYCGWGRNYLTVFRPEDVNFCPLFWLDRRNLNDKEIRRILLKAETRIYENLQGNRLRPRVAWLQGIEPAELVDKAIKALTPMKGQFKIFRRPAYVNCGPLPSLGQLSLMFV